MVKQVSKIKGAGAKDCLLVFKPNGEVQLHMPELDPNAPVQDYMELATIVMVLLTTQDKDLYRLIKKKQKEIRVEYQRLISS